MVLVLCSKKKKYDRVAGLVEQVLFDENLNKKQKILQAKRIEKYKKDSEPEKLFVLLREL